MEWTRYVHILIRLVLRWKDRRTCAGKTPSSRLMQNTMYPRCMHPRPHHTIYTNIHVSCTKIDRHPLLFLSDGDRRISPPSYMLMGTSKQRVVCKILRYELTEHLWILLSAYLTRWVRHGATADRMSSLSSCHGLSAWRGAHPSSHRRPHGQCRCRRVTLFLWEV